jgi:hypothetical protein
MRAAFSSSGVRNKNAEWMKQIQCHIYIYIAHPEEK